MFNEKEKRHYLDSKREGILFEGTPKKPTNRKETEEEWRERWSRTLETILGCRS